MIDFDSIWRTQDEIRTVVNAVLGALGLGTLATNETQECIWIRFIIQYFYAISAILKYNSTLQLQIS